MSMNITNLHTLLVHELKDLYSAEKQVLKALPKMERAAKNGRLVEAFRMHREETERQVQRLEEIFADLDYKPRGEHCKGMEGLIEEGESMVTEDAPDDVKDAGLIAAAQRVEHYEIAGYGTARTFAMQLGMQRAADLLQQTLDEEAAANEKLTRIAENEINQQAMDG